MVRDPTRSSEMEANLLYISSWGELTDLGRLSTMRLGKQLRARYVDK